MDNNYDYYNNEEIKTFLTYADRAEKILKSEGYAKREDNIGLGDYYYDRDEEYGGEFSFLSNTRFPIKFRSYYDYELSATMFEIERPLQNIPSCEIVSPEKWINHISEIVKLKIDEDKQMQERKAEYLSEHVTCNNTPTSGESEDNVIHFRRR